MFLSFFIQFSAAWMQFFVAWRTHLDRKQWLRNTSYNSTHCWHCSQQDPNHSIVGRFSWSWTSNVMARIFHSRSHFAQHCSANLEQNDEQAQQYFSITGLSTTQPKFLSPPPQCLCRILCRILATWGYSGTVVSSVFVRTVWSNLRHGILAQHWIDLAGHDFRHQNKMCLCPKTKMQVIHKFAFAMKSKPYIHFWRQNHSGAYKVKINPGTPEIYSEQLSSGIISAFVSRTLCVAQLFSPQRRSVGPAVVPSMVNQRVKWHKHWPHVHIFNFAVFPINDLLQNRTWDKMRLCSFQNELNQSWPSINLFISYR